MTRIFLIRHCVKPYKKLIRSVGYFGYPFKDDGYCPKTLSMLMFIIHKFNIDNNIKIYADNYTERTAETGAQLCRYLNTDLYLSNLIPDPNMRQEGDNKINIPKIYEKIFIILQKYLIDKLSVKPEDIKTITEIYSMSYFYTNINIISNTNLIYSLFSTIDHIICNMKSNFNLKIINMIYNLLNTSNDSIIVAHDSQIIMFLLYLKINIWRFGDFLPITIPPFATLEIKLLNRCNDKLYISLNTYDVWSNKLHNLGMYYLIKSSDDFINDYFSIKAI